MFLLLSLFLAVFLMLLAYYRAILQPMAKLANKIPGPKPLPILGNILEFGFNPKYYFNKGLHLLDDYGKVVRLWIGPSLIFFFAEPKYVEELLNSQKAMQKADFYMFLKPWLGEGLLLSTGNRWRLHRKLITPAFHFKILEQFVDVYERNAKILVETFNTKYVNGPEFDVCHDIEMCALDNICETAMGVTINAQKGSNLEYVEAVRSFSDITFERAMRPWIHPDFIFRFSSRGRKLYENVSVMRAMTDSVIAMRKKEMKENNLVARRTNDDNGIKRRLAFLDLLLQTSADGVSFTDEEIRVQVDTILFGGYDTISTAMSFCLWCLSKYQNVQEKAVQELKNIFEGSDRNATHQDLQNMRYLEMVIKESLRLYPSPLLFGRKVTENVKMGDYVFPAGADIFIIPYFLHRHPDYFPDPEKFDPERFSPENSVGRHPYCYVPFSAGSRNCIGQKYAVLEMKSTISKILRNFEIIESDSKEEFTFTADLMLKPINGVKLKLKSRKIEAV